MSGMNNVSLIGRLTKDVEIRKTNTGKSVASFTLAVARKMQDATDFIDCVAWSSSADYLGNYGKKGDMVSVVGSLQKRDYESNGNKVFVTEVHTNDVSIVSKAKQKTEEFPDVPTMNVTDDMLPF